MFAKAIERLPVFETKLPEEGNFELRAVLLQKSSQLRDVVPMNAVEQLDDSNASPATSTKVVPKGA
jgi:hypothetical protein